MNFKEPVARFAHLGPGASMDALRCISDLVSDLMLLHRDGLLGVLHHVPKLCECLLDRGGFRGNVVFGTWWDFFFLSQESLDGWCDRLITSPIDFQTYGVPPSRFHARKWNDDSW